LKPEEFRSMDLRKDILEMINKKGFKRPTPIQIETIPLALKGYDIMGQAQTGTGKTASFGLPLLNKIDQGQGTQALVLCPTRELAVQVANEISFLGMRTGINVLPVYGGQAIQIQMRALTKLPEIIVGTPGRLLDHLRRRSISLSKVRFVVLDEADEMLDMGFLPDIEDVLQQCPRERQTFLFSATLNKNIRELGKRYMKDPQLIEIEAPELTVPIIDQRYYRVDPGKKLQTLYRILDVEQPPVSLIFCNTKRSVDELSSILKYRGLASEGLHGDMSQRERDTVMKQFRRGYVKVLVATDLAARGLDISLVTHVINFDIPEDPDSYVHRIGRTGRAGRKGIAISLVEPAQMRNLRFIERHIKKSIPRQVLPALADVVEQRKDILIKTMKLKLDEYKEIANDLLNKYDAEDIVAAALKLIVDDAPGMEIIDQEESNSNNTAHMEIPMGRLQGIYPRRIVEVLTTHTALSARQVGDIEVHKNSTYVEVPMDYIDEVYQVFNHLGKEKKRHYKKNKITREAN